MKEENKMYEYLLEHNYISKNETKSPLRQQELSKERAECIVNKYDSLIKDLQSQLKAKEEVIKEAREYVNHSKKNIDESGMYVETYTKWKLVSDVLDDLLEILSKGENK